MSKEILKKSYGLDLNCGYTENVKEFLKRTNPRCYFHPDKEASHQMNDIHFCIKCFYYWTSVRDGYSRLCLFLEHEIKIKERHEDIDKKTDIYI